MIVYANRDGEAPLADALAPRLLAAVGLESGRLARAFEASSLADLSGGLWRRLAYASESVHPAVHAPYHLPWEP